MAIIKINNLNTAGFDLFNDSESYLNDLTDDEMSLTQGGSSPVCYFAMMSGIYAARSSFGCVNAANAAVIAVTSYGQKKKWW
jgi:hypothetical protein